MTLYEQRLSEDLGAIRAKVQDISDRVCRALEKTVAAAATGDRDALYQVVMDDYSINRDIRCIDKRCHEFVARHLPAAGHLRFISAVLRLTIALERAGDYAVTISRVVLQLARPFPERLIDKLKGMSQISVTMMTEATEAFLSGNAQMAAETKMMDYKVDKSYEEVFAVLVDERARREPMEIVSLLEIFSKIERFCDQAKNICEEAIFSATGKMKELKAFKMLFVDRRNELESQLAAAIAGKAFPDAGIYASAGLAPADKVSPKLFELAVKFGFDVARARPTKIGPLDTFPHPYHLIVAINIDESALPKIPYHTILRHWKVADLESPEELVRDLSSRMSALMEALRGKNGKE